MTFDTDKKKTLDKMSSNDKSNKGSVDKLILPLINKINKQKNFYTTSSCSGRIILIRIPKSGRTREAEFVFRTHQVANSDELISVIKQSLNLKEAIWFRQEPAILHVASRTLDDASYFLRIARTLGFKRGGLFEVEKRFLMEIASTERIDALVANEGQLLVDDDYLRVLVDEANKRLQKTWEKTEKLNSKFT